MEQEVNSPTCLEYQFTVNKPLQPSGNGHVTTVFHRVTPKQDFSELKKASDQQHAFTTTGNEKSGVENELSNLHLNASENERSSATDDKFSEYDKTMDLCKSILKDVNSLSRFPIAADFDENLHSHKSNNELNHGLYSKQQRYSGYPTVGNFENNHKILQRPYSDVPKFVYKDSNQTEHNSKDLKTSLPVMVRDSNQTEHNSKDLKTSLPMTGRDTVRNSFYTDHIKSSPHSQSQLLSNINEQPVYMQQTMSTAQADETFNKGAVSGRHSEPTLLYSAFSPVNSASQSDVCNLNQQQVLPQTIPSRSPLQNRPISPPKDPDHKLYHSLPLKETGNQSTKTNRQYATSEKKNNTNDKTSVAKFFRHLRDATPEKKKNSDKKHTSPEKKKMSERKHHQPDKLASMIFGNLTAAKKNKNTASPKFPISRRANKFLNQESFEDAPINVINNWKDDEVENQPTFKFPVEPGPVVSCHRKPCQGTWSSIQTSCSESSTVEEIIAEMSPDLTIQPIKPLTVKNLARMSVYDNMDRILAAGTSAASHPNTVVESSLGTAYCKPWDSNFMENLMKSGMRSLKRQQSKESKDDGMSSLYPDSITEDEAGMISEAPTAFGSEVATSFEWQNDYDTDSATDTLPQTPQMSDHNPGDQPFPTSRSSTPALKMGLSFELPCQTYVSDDEGVENDHSPAEPNIQNVIFPFFMEQRLSNAQNQGARNVGLKIRDHICCLADDKKTMFGQNVLNFVKCTNEGTEKDPLVVMRNVRQFMNGIKNYLIQYSEESLTNLIESERQRLEGNQFLNIDAIIEGALHKCVILPVKQHIYTLFVKEYQKNGCLRELSENIKYARTKTPQELGIKPGIDLPHGTALEVVKYFLIRVQRAYSPLKKLENLLMASSLLHSMVYGFQGTKTAMQHNKLRADDFLPVLMYVLVHCGMVGAEIEADYMWGLLHARILSGEAGYYLTALSSAIQMLKNLKTMDESTLGKHGKQIHASCDELQGFLKVIIPDEKSDSIIIDTVPILPNMTTKDFSCMISHRFKITNPQDYGLYVLVKGVENHLSELDCPDTVKNDLQTHGHDCVFAFKRINARFIWPKKV